MNEYFRRIAFAEAIAALKRNPNNPALSIPVRGRDVSVSQICEEMVNDRGVMPDFLARELGLAPPVTFAKGASYLKQYLVLPTSDVWEKKWRPRATELIRVIPGRRVRPAHAPQSLCLYQQLKLR